MSKSEWRMPHKITVRINRWIRTNPTQRKHFEHDDPEAEITVEEAFLATYLYNGPINPNNFEKLVNKIRLMVNLNRSIENLVRDGFIRIESQNEYGDRLLVLTEKGIERNIKFRERIGKTRKR